jgi:ABC-type Fe3+-siderophore transport system permease subunit
MVLTRTGILLPAFSVAALTAGVILFLTDSSRTNFLTLFATLLLWFLGCAMLIVWSAGITFRENKRNANDSQPGEAIKRVG